MKAKVIIAQATAETVGFLYELVKRMAEKTAIKAYPSVDYQACFSRWINTTCICEAGIGR